VPFNADYISSIGQRSKWVPSIGNAMLATKVDPYVTTNSNVQGNGVGIYYADVNCPNERPFIYANYDTNVAYRFDKPGDSHTHLITGILDKVAPQAMKYCTKSPGLNEPVSSLDKSIFPQNAYSSIASNIQIETYSTNEEADETEYGTIDLAFDNQVVNEHNLITVSTGNQGGIVKAPARAYNVLSVGAYVDSGTSSYKPIWNSSNYENDHLAGNEKPELVAPGESISYTRSDGVTYSDSGTSFATPHVAALGADFMSDYASLHGDAMATKALLLASASDAIADRSGMPSGESAVGAGGINAYSGLYRKRLAMSVDANDLTIIESDVSCTNKTFSAYATETARVAMTWRVDGEYIKNNATLGSIYFFVITDRYQNEVAYSWLGNSNNWDHDNWSVTEFNVATSGTHTIILCRYDDFSPHNEPVDVGLAVVTK
jgi:hypothetical protein